MKNGIAVALLFVGLISVILGIVCFSMENGAKELNSYYGGDAYTGIQQAAAQGARNGYYGNNILCLGFGSVLMVAGMVIMLLAINSILKNEFGGGGSAKAGDSASGRNSADSGSDYACSENADGTLCIKKYYGETSDLCIPEKIRGKAVTALGPSSFSGCGFLTSVVIPKGVVSIGDESFLGCKSLADLTIPDSVTDIRTGAFRGCRSLTAVTIPDSVEIIGESAFADCRLLTSVTIRDHVTAIGEFAFSGCPCLTVTVSRGSYAEKYCKDNGLLMVYAC